MELNTRDFERHQTDWETAQTLYVVGGLTARQIKLAPEFSHLSQRQIENRITDEGWAGKRERYLESKVAILGRNVSEQMKRGAESFRSTVGLELETELKLYQARPKGKTENDQKNRLDLLTRLVNIGEKIYPVDQFQLSDPVKQGFQSLTQFNIGQGATIALHPPSAVNPLPDNQNKTTGILVELGGVPVGGLEFKITQVEETSQKPIEVEAEVASVQTQVSDEEALRLAQEAAAFRKEEEVSRAESKAKKTFQFGGAEPAGEKEAPVEETLSKKSAKKKSQD